MTVLDASAVLAVLNDEPGAEMVERAMLAGGAIISSANLAEVLGKVVDVGGDVIAVASALRASGLEVASLDEKDAAIVAALRAVDGGRTLSLGDRCAIALAARSRPSVVLTADRVWADLDLPAEVHLIR